MKDRIATNPGRVRLVPVPGQTNIYDMTMADNPTEQGTALNKANLLTDATAAAILAEFGSTPDTPNEAFALLATSLKMERLTYVGTGTYGSANKNTLTFTNVPKFVIIFEDRVTGANGTYMAFIDWQRLIDNAGEYTSRFILSLSGSNIYEQYKLTNNNKTISWYCNSATQAEQQLNGNNAKYGVISFY